MFWGESNLGIYGVIRAHTYMATFTKITKHLHIKLQAHAPNNIVGTNKTQAKLNKSIHNGRIYWFAGNPKGGIPTKITKHA